MMLAQGFELGARIIFKRELFHFAEAERGGCAPLCDLVGMV